ncbi:amino acid racemase [Curvibacter sp. RS43]|uniref:aspartate/glutamate racemase family protein n=1 Tax=Curvibacter microcysteis TaxID=3026419 RepID=UPI00235E9FED|nr:amino acid racemase [Curvibacter sp. RS43]MDD0811051.1 amino acid racemase [Curvibacter sp. RS43]
MSAPLHIGIVGCSAEGAALCYRTVCEEGARWLGPHGHPEVSLHTPSLRHYVDCLERQDLAGVAALMLDSAHKLAAAGADFLICPDNTIHQAFEQVRPHSPRPWLHIAEVVAEAARARGFRRLGLTGTRWLLDSGVYPQALAAQGLDCVRPTPEVRAAMGQLIMDELVRGVLKAASVQRFQAWVQDFQQQGCDAVVLGCTEIPLILNDSNSALPTLDSTRLLARAALCRALGPEPGA